MLTDCSFDTMLWWYLWYWWCLRWRCGRLLLFMLKWLHWNYLLIVFVLLLIPYYWKYYSMMTVLSPWWYCYFCSVIDTIWWWYTLYLPFSDIMIPDIVDTACIMGILLFDTDDTLIFDGSDDCSDDRVIQLLIHSCYSVICLEVPFYHFLIAAVLLEILVLILLFLTAILWYFLRDDANLIPDTCLQTFPGIVRCRPYSTVYHSCCSCRDIMTLRTIRLEVLVPLCIRVCVWCSVMPFCGGLFILTDGDRPTFAVVSTGDIRGIADVLPHCRCSSADVCCGIRDAWYWPFDVLFWKVVLPLFTDGSPTFVCCAFHRGWSGAFVYYDAFFVRSDYCWWW